MSFFMYSYTLLRLGRPLPPEPDTDPRLQFLLSRCLTHLGRGVEARAVLKRLIADYPGHAVTATAKETLAAMK
jgi:TolA-binding protein